MALDVGELVARLTIDDERFTRGAAQAERRMDDLSTSARQAGQRIDSSLSDAARSTDRLDRGATSARQSLGRVGDTSRDVDRVRESARDAEREVGRLGQAAERAGGGLQSLAGSISERAGGEGGASFVGAFTERIGGLGAKAGPIGAALVGVAAIGVTAGVALAEGIRQGMEQQAALDLFGVQTGTTEEQAKVAGQAAANAYAQNFGESIDANMRVLRMSVQQGIIDPNIDRENAQQVIAAISGISAAFEVEDELTTKAISSLINSGMVDDWTEAADLLSSAVGGSANRAGDLVEVVDEYAAGWKNAGISAQTALGFIEQTTDAGAWNADVAGDALREFGRRVSEEGETMVEALDGIGLAGQDTFDKLTAGGPEAEAAFANIVRELQGIEDQTERNNAIAAIFGDTSGDFYRVFGEIDMDQMAAGLDGVSGATDRLNARMASNPAADVETAFRTLEVAGNDLKLALAEGFGPGISDFATWISEHKPELIAFFTDLVDGALLCAEGIARFVSMSLDVIGPFGVVLSEAFASALDTMGVFVSGAAKVADALGMDGLASDLNGAAGFLDEYAEGARTGAERMMQLGDAIDNKAIPALQNIRAGVREAGDQAANSEVMMRALGEAVITGIPDDKSIMIADNSPEAIQRLKDLGFTVETTPNGIRVTAATGEAETIITDFINRERSAEVTLKFRQDQVSYWQAMGAAKPSAMVGPTPVGRADGAVQVRSFANGKLPDQAIVQPAVGRHGLVQWAEGETEGEAFIPLARSKRARSEQILQEVARRFGLGLVRLGPVEAEKVFRGDPKSLDEVSDPTGWRAMLGGDYSGRSARFGIQEDHPLVDIVLGVRKAIAEGDYDGSLAKYGVQEDSPITDLLLGLNKGLFAMADGGIVEGGFNAQAAIDRAKSKAGSPYDYATLYDCSGHLSDVFNAGTGQSVRFTTASDFGAMGWAPGYDPNGFSIGTNGGVGEDGHMAGTLYGVNVESDGSNGVQYGDGADGAQDFPYVWHWPGATRSGDDASTERVGMVTGADNPGIYEGPLPRTGRTAGASDGGAVLSTDGTRVFVTNWPASLGGTAKPEDERTPILTAGLKVFANGGVEDHTAQIAPAGAMRLWAEEETGGEAYIPLAASKRTRSVGITAEVARRFGYRLVPMADGGLTGFGGYAGDDRSWLDIPLDGSGEMSANRQRANAYNALALGVGGLFALASGFDADGRFTGQFDTGANSHPALEKGFGEFSDATLELLQQILEAARTKTPVDVQVDIDRGTGMANIEITKRGL